VFHATTVTTALPIVSLLCAYRLHRQTSVTIIIGSTKRHCPNWRRSAERFAFGIAAQLRAATRDFPVHERLHASQTSKGCSFTGYRRQRGWGHHIGWTMGGRREIAAPSPKGVRPTQRGRRERVHCGYSKTNIRLGQVKSFPGWKLAWKSATWKVRVIVGVSVDCCRLID